MKPILILVLAASLGANVWQHYNQVIVFNPPKIEMEQPFQYAAALALNQSDIVTTDYEVLAHKDPRTKMMIRCLMFQMGDDHYFHIEPNYLLPECWPKPEPQQSWVMKVFHWRRANGQG